AAAALAEHDWPGNVRELKNTIERSVYRSDDPEQPITTIIFDPFESPFGPLRDISQGPRAAAQDEGEPAAADGNGRSNGEARSGDGASRWPVDFRAAVAAFERETLEDALEHSKYKQTIAARLLGLSYHQLRGLLKKH